MALSVNCAEFALNLCWICAEFRDSTHQTTFDPGYMEWFDLCNVQMEVSQVIGVPQILQVIKNHELVLKPIETVLG